MDAFRWTEKSIEAAKLIANGELTFGEIAAQVGVTPQGLWLWRKHPEFAAKVDEHIEEIRIALSRRAISFVERRVASLNTRWLKLHRVIEERSADPVMATAAGGSTGLLVRTEKALGGGEFARIVDEFAVDTGLLKELREIEAQAAKELNQWTERHSIDLATKSYEAANTPESL